jgi:hypothetical protein
VPVPGVVTLGAPPPVGVPAPPPVEPARAVARDRNHVAGGERLELLDRLERVLGAELVELGDRHQWLGFECLDQRLLGERIAGAGR